MQENELFISVTQFLRKDNIISYELKFLLLFIKV